MRMLWLQRCEIEMVPRILLHQKTLHEQQHIADWPLGKSALVAQVASVLLKQYLPRRRNGFGRATGRDALLAQEIE